MDNKIALELKEKLGDKRDLFEKLHKLILSLDKEIDFCVFPIYVRYSLGEKNIALIYFKGKFVANGGFDLGLSLEKNPPTKGFTKAKHMKYPGITHSIKLRKLKDINPIIKTIRSITE